MSPNPIPPLSQCRFRTAEAFELVVFDRLPDQEQTLLADLCQDPDFYGVLKPCRGSALTVKAVDRETALLLYTLRQPGPLPFFVGDEADAEEAVEQLVLSGVLEVELDGRFVSGAAAACALAADEDAGERAGAGRLGRLSLAALRHGEAAAVDDPQRLAALLYNFNRAPLAPRWAARLPDAAAVLEFVGACPGSRLLQRLQADWDYDERDSAPGWIVFSRRGGQAAGRRGAAYKLYISPAIESMPAAFTAVVELLSDRPRGAFKIGADAAGLLRPDKMVAYFDDLEQLEAAARHLEPRLAGLPAQGVPFTAPIDGEGLLSWGMDPPAGERLLAWQEPESWRLWVVKRLAASLIAARGDASDQMPAWRFALEQLRRESVDVDRWTPSAALWAAA